MTEPQTAEDWGRLAVLIPGWKNPDDDRFYLPDPDHWAWEGWLLALLGDTFADITFCGDSYMLCIVVDGNILSRTQRTIGRACIAAAAALGRWPGGSDG